MNRQNLVLRLRCFRYQALGLAVAALTLSACAQKMTPHTEAWDLIDETAQQDKQAKPVANQNKRQALWLDSYAQDAYYASSPAHKAVARRDAARAAAQPEQPQTKGSPLASRTMDAQDPRGWTQSDLVERWGAPARVVKDQWIYENRDAAGRCLQRKMLRIVEGVVSSAKNDRCS